MEFKNIEKLNVEEDEFILSLSEKFKKMKDTYVYIKSLAKYYWVESQIFFTPNDVMNNLLLSPKELKSMRQY